MNIATPEVVAQLAHVGWGAALTFTLAALDLPLWASATIVAAVAFAKEFIEYQWGVWEPKQSWRDSLVDFVFFLVGEGAAFAVLLLR